MVCELLDISCWLVNEIIGSALLVGITLSILYFIIASKNNFGFDTTIAFAIPVILLFSIVIGGFTLTYLILIFIVGLMIAWMFNKIIT